VYLAQAEEEVSEPREEQDARTNDQEDLQDIEFRSTLDEEDT